MHSLFKMWHNINYSLFPWLEDELGKLSPKEKQFIGIVTLMDLPKYSHEFPRGTIGRTPKSRINILKAFTAKTVYNLNTTKGLIQYLKDSPNLRLLCGWEKKNDVPSESTFSRAFAEISTLKLIEKIHTSMFECNYKNKIAGHLSRDSTAIIAREKPVKTVTIEPKEKRKPGRPRKNEIREPKEPKRLDLQSDRSLSENIKDLPNYCNVCTKKNSKGKKETWIGYKLHLDCVDGDIPVSAILTSASLHDSQVAIPLSQMSSTRVTNLYDLMDAAYDSHQIHSFSESLGHQPVIDDNPRRSGIRQKMDIIEKIRYKQRSSIERVNGYLKDNYGGRTIRVKGPSKVMTHLMFGIIAITATQLLKLL